VTIRPAAPGDAAACAEIYNLAAKMRDAEQPMLVAERDGAVIGWASVTRWSNRCVYGGVGEYTVYLDRAARGQGAGTALLEALCAAAEQAGYWKLLGQLFTTNAASIALARRCGFAEVGTHVRHGRLDGAWRDVLLVERLLGPART
jgi:phosphinothricin acetyltransferase